MSRATKFCRETAAAWIVGGGIWLAGIGGLAYATAPAIDGSMGVAGNAGASYFIPANTWSTYQDPSGKYRVVERTLRRVLAD